MDGLLDFLRAALPWICIGLVLALTAASYGGKKELLRKNLIWPTAGMAIVSILEFMDHDKSSATTWLVLAIAFFVIGMTKKEDEEGEKDSKSGTSSPKANANATTKSNAAAKSKTTAKSVNKSDTTAKLNREQRRRAKKSK